MPLGFVVENNHDVEENSELAGTNAIAGDGFRPNFKIELPGKTTMVCWWRPWCYPELEHHERGKLVRELQGQAEVLKQTSELGSHSSSGTSNHERREQLSELYSQAQVSGQTAEFVLF